MRAKKEVLKSNIQKILGILKEAPDMSAFETGLQDIDHLSVIGCLVPCTLECGCQLYTSLGVLLTVRRPTDIRCFSELPK